MRFKADIDIQPSPSLVDQNVAVVCSARSSSTKAEGTTNR
jgi:aspartate kinase